MWKCPNCQNEVDDSAQKCPKCEQEKTQPISSPSTVHTEAVSPDPNGKITWRYSGKAFRSRCIFNWVLTVALICLGFYLMSKGVIDDKRILWGIILAVLAIDWLWFVCNYFYKTNFILYRLSEAHLYAEHGLFQRTINTMELIGINDLRMRQSLWDRFINGGVGTVEVFSVSDKTDEVQRMTGMENPQEVLEKIDSARRRLRGRGIVQM